MYKKNITHLNSISKLILLSLSFQSFPVEVFWLQSLFSNSVFFLLFVKIYHQRTMDNPPESTQSISRVTYSWVILFMYSVDVEYPFSCMNLRNLANTDFPFYLIEGSLDDNSRIIPFKLFSDDKYCVFAKIEIGKSIVYLV